MKRNGWMILLLATACANYAPPEKLARQFMDAYYVETNLPAASQMADGLALQKIQESLQLREGQLMTDTTHHPRISYKLLEGRLEGGEAEYLFAVTIEPEKSDPFRKNSRIKVRERAGGWKVTQFSDYESAAPDSKIPAASHE